MYLTVNTIDGVVKRFRVSKIRCRNNGAMFFYKNCHDTIPTCEIKGYDFIERTVNNVDYSLTTKSNWYYVTIEESE